MNTDKLASILSTDTGLPAGAVLAVLLRAAPRLSDPGRSVVAPPPYPPTDEGRIATALHARAEEADRAYTDALRYTGEYTDDDGNPLDIGGQTAARAEHHRSALARAIVARNWWRVVASL